MEWFGVCFDINRREARGERREMNEVCVGKADCECMVSCNAIEGTSLGSESLLRIDVYLMLLRTRKKGLQ